MIKISNLSILRKRFLPADYLLIFIGIIMGISSLIFHQKLDNSATFFILDILFLGLLCFFIIKDDHKNGSVISFLHLWLPIISLAFFYTQSTAYDNLIFANTFDPFLQRTENAIFGNFRHLDGFPGNHLIIDEFFHMCYFFYYLLLFIPGLIMYSRSRRNTHIMIFTITLMMVSNFLFFILFPGDGPVAERENIFRDGILFIPIMEFVYKIGGAQGGGAFPSTHVADSVLICISCFSSCRVVRWPVLVLTIGIIIATIYCSYHYTIDAVTGLVTGIVFYFIGRKIYGIFSFQPD